MAAPMALFAFCAISLPASFALRNHQIIPVSHIKNNHGTIIPLPTANNINETGVMSDGNSSSRTPSSENPSSGSSRSSTLLWCTDVPLKQGSMDDVKMGFMVIGQVKLSMISFLCFVRSTSLYLASANLNFFLYFDITDSPV